MDWYGSFEKGRLCIEEAIVKRRALAAVDPEIDLYRALQALCSPKSPTPIAKCIALLERAHRNGSADAKLILDLIQKSPLDACSDAKERLAIFGVVHNGTAKAIGGASLLTLGRTDGSGASTVDGIAMLEESIELGCAHAFNWLAQVKSVKTDEEFLKRGMEAGNARCFSLSNPEHLPAIYEGALRGDEYAAGWILMKPDFTMEQKLRVFAFASHTFLLIFINSVKRKKIPPLDLWLIGRGIAFDVYNANEEFCKLVSETKCLETGLLLYLNHQKLVSKSIVTLLCILRSKFLPRDLRGLIGKLVWRDVNKHDWIDATICETSPNQSLSETLARFDSWETIQPLWKGTGSVMRVKLTSESRILKFVSLCAPKNVGEERKLKSYAVERRFYQHFAKRASNCAIPKCHNADSNSLLLEDISDEYPIQISSISEWPRFALLIDWLANFHASFLQQVDENESLWTIGNYWHLGTRLEEWHSMPDSILKRKAFEIDKKLCEARFKTLCHGDSKFQNFAFSETSCVGFDFQYCGFGVGVSDLVYLVSYLDADLAQQWHSKIQNSYFETLKANLQNFQHFKALKDEWSELYSFCCADFLRFLHGWAGANHERPKNTYLMHQAQSALFDHSEDQEHISSSSSCDNE